MELPLLRSRTLHRQGSGTNPDGNAADAAAAAAGDVGDDDDGALAGSPATLTDGRSSHGDPHTATARRAALHAPHIQSLAQSVSGAGDGARACLFSCLFASCSLLAGRGGIALTPPGHAIQRPTHPIQRHLLLLV